MGQSFNLGQLVGSTNFAECPTGPQVVKVDGAEAVTASTGRPMVKVALRIQGGEFDNRSVKDQLVLVVDNPDAIGMFVGKLHAFGCDTPELLAQCQDSLEPLARALVGQAANVTLYADTYNGVTRPKVKSYDSPAFLETNTPEVIVDDDPGF